MRWWTCEKFCGFLLSSRSPSFHLNGRLRSVPVHVHHCGIEDISPLNRWHMATNHLSLPPWRDYWHCETKSPRGSSNTKHVTKYSPQAQKNISKHHLRLYSEIARHTDAAAPDRVQIWNPCRILIYYTYFHFVTSIISSTLQNILRKHKKTSRNITSGFTPKSLATRMTPPQTEFRYGILVEFWSSTTIYIILQLAPGMGGRKGWRYGRAGTMRYHAGCSMWYERVQQRGRGGAISDDACSFCVTRHSATVGNRQHQGQHHNNTTDPCTRDIS